MEMQQLKVTAVRRDSVQCDDIQTSSITTEVHTQLGQTLTLAQHVSAANS